MNIRNLSLILLLSASVAAQTANLGLFTNSGDVGNPAIKGSAEFADGQYKLTGSGANIWAKDDQFQFVWKEMSGNFTVTATMKFLGKGADHRKAGIMVRQTLDNDAPYADVVMHGTGMPAIQWRNRKGEDTNTLDLPIQGPGTYRIRMVRTGVKTYLYLAKEGGEPKEIVHTELALTNPVMVGLFVCSHDVKASDTVVFSDVTVDSQ